MVFAVLAVAAGVAFVGWRWRRDTLAQEAREAALAATPPVSEDAATVAKWQALCLDYAPPADLLVYSEQLGEGRGNEAPAPPADSPVRHIPPADWPTPKPSTLPASPHGGYSLVQPDAGNSTPSVSVYLGGRARRAGRSGWYGWT